MARESAEAPFTVTSNMVRRDSVEVSKGNPQYRNRQYVKGSKAKTDALTEYHEVRTTPQGETPRSFPVGSQ